MAMDISLSSTESEREVILPEEVAKEYYNLGYEKGWKSALKVDKENAEKLQEFTKYE